MEVVAVVVVFFYFSKFTNQFPHMQINILEYEGITAAASEIKFEPRYD